MRVPNQILRETVLVADYEGSGARGPVYAEPRELRANVQPSTAVVSDIYGVKVNVSLRIIIRPEAGPVPPESKCTTRGATYRVVQSYPMPDARRPSQWELLLADFAAGRTPGGSGSGGS